MHHQICGELLDELVDDVKGSAPHSAQASGRSSCASASRWSGIGLRPVGLAFFFGGGSGAGLWGLGAILESTPGL
ncbi:MAG: hypothetical protein U0263_41415, partial [Polyangiaceae bacterium]